jgi:hypothetical protein
LAICFPGDVKGGLSLSNTSIDMPPTHTLCAAAATFVEVTLAAAVAAGLGHSRQHEELMI